MCINQPQLVSKFKLKNIDLFITIIALAEKLDVKEDIFYSNFKTFSLY